MPNNTADATVTKTPPDAMVMSITVTNASSVTLAEASPDSMVIIMLFLSLSIKTHHDVMVAKSPSPPVAMVLPAATNPNADIDSSHSPE